MVNFLVQLMAIYVKLATRRITLKLFVDKGMPAKKTVYHVENETLQSSSSDDEYVYTIHAVKGQNNVPVTTIKINNIPVCFQIDSGAGVNIINEHEFSKISKTVNLNLQKSDKKLYSYGSDQSLSLAGCFVADIESSNTIDIAKF